MGEKVNKSRLALILGKSERTLTEWQKEGMPLGSRGEKRGQANCYDTEEVINWMMTRASARADDSEIEKHRIRLTKSQADKTELEVEILRGNLLATDEVELAWSNLVLNIRSRIMGIAARLSPRLTGKKVQEIEKLIKSAHIEALQELSKNVGYNSEESAGENNPEVNGETMPTTRTNDKRVGGRKQKAKQRGKRRTR